MAEKRNYVLWFDGSESENVIKMTEEQARAVVCVLTEFVSPQFSLDMGLELAEDYEGYEIWLVLI